jgi:hypothetical protein
VCNVQYQKKAALLTSLASLWPMPAEMSYIYNQGFLALAAVLNDDHRATLLRAALHGGAAGRAGRAGRAPEACIWLGNWLEVTN